MKVFLLAAGIGKRLRPLTNSLPKPLIEVHGKPIILWSIERLRESGFKDIVINLFYKGEQIKKFLGDGSNYGVKIEYSFEDDLLGTGGGIQKALNLLGDEQFLLVSTDIWTDYNFEKICMPNNSQAHMVLIQNPDSNYLGDAYLNQGLVKITGKGSKLTYSGISLLEPQLFSHINCSKYELWDSVLLPASEENLVTGEVFKGALFNINNIEDIERLDSYLAQS